VTRPDVSKRTTTPATAAGGSEKTPIRMLHDRVLVALDREPGERKSSGGILIPATAAMGGKRLSWCRVVAVGALVRSVEVDDRVLFDPEEKAEVEVHGEPYIVLRERDIHAVAADRLGDSPTGLYL
jgi:chaperonin GroES